MAEMVKTVVYDAPEKDVLLNPDNAFQIGVVVSATGVQADANGRKIIKAGTPVGATDSALLVRGTTLKVTNDAENANLSQGVLRHDVDVTAGSADATLIVRGEVDISKTPDILDAVMTTLKHIIFVDGGL